MRRYLLLLTICLVAVLSGCSSSRPATTSRPALPSGFPSHTAAEIHQLMLHGTDTLQAYRATARLTVRSPEQNGTFSAEMHHRRQDSLYLTLSPGLGIEAARALVTPDSFFVYNRIKQRLTFGSLQGAAPNLPPVLTTGNLFATLTDLLVPPSDTDWRVHADSAYYHLRSPDERRRYVVDPTTWRVVRYEERGPSGELVEERLFSRFERVGGLHLPRQIVFRRPQENSSAVITFRKRTFNPAQLRLALNVPSSAERRRVN